MEEKIKELNLLLLYLTGWEEDSRKNPGEKVFCTWNGYSFKTLNTLHDEKMIVQIKDKKLVIVTELATTRCRGSGTSTIWKRIPSKWLPVWEAHSISRAPLRGRTIESPGSNLTRRRMMITPPSALIEPDQSVAGHTLTVVSGLSRLPQTRRSM